MTHPTANPRREADRTWDMSEQVRSFFRDPAAWLAGGFGGRSDVDVEETADGWVIEARLPGVAPEEVEVEVTDRELAIRARHPNEVDDSDPQPENRYYSQYAYRMTLPPTADPEKIDATMDHGLLVVRIPHTANAQPRRIAVGRARPEFSRPPTDVAAPS